MKNHYSIPWICLIILMAFQHILPNAITAQVKFTAKISASKVTQNSEFTVTFTLSGGKGSSFTPPAFSGLNTIGFSKVITQGSDVTSMNGKIVNSESGSEQWEYTLTGSKLGTFTIGSAKIKVKNKWVSSNNVKVEIVKGNSKTKQAQNKNQQVNSEKKSSDDIHIKAIIDKTNVSLGEQLTVTYKIYTNISIEHLNYVNNAGYNGFWTHDLSSITENTEQHKEIINGVEYIVADIRKIALFPQKTGTLKIDPLEIDCFTKVESNNGFFTSYYLDRKTIRSNALTINVNPLPELEKPETFSGAVGNFSFNATLDRNEVKQNEAINLRLSVNGTGNISLIELPTPEFPADFEVYDPEMNENIVQNSNPVSGSRTYDYLIMPRNPGTFTIKPFTFSYYDPKQRAYKSISSEGFTIKVGKGIASQSGKPVNQEEVELIGNDIRFMAPQSLPLTVIGSNFYNSLWFYISLLIPALLFIAFVIIWRRRIRINSNVALRKHLRATAVANKRLTTAKKHLQQEQSSEFFVEVSRALWGYVCDKFSIPLSELSINSVDEKLLHVKVKAEVRDRLVNTLNQCEFARFAPAGQAPDMQALYNEASSIIMDIEQDLNSIKAKKKS